MCIWCLFKHSQAFLPKVQGGGVLGCSGKGGGIVAGRVDGYSGVGLSTIYQKRRLSLAGRPGRGRARMGNHWVFCTHVTCWSWGVGLQNVLYTPTFQVKNKYWQFKLFHRFSQCFFRSGVWRQDTWVWPHLCMTQASTPARLTKHVNWIVSSFPGYSVSLTNTNLVPLFPS